MTKVLDKGYVEWVDCMGDETRIVEAARVSVGAKKKAKRSDAELIEYLYTAGHMSPFEHVHFTFKVKAPIFVLRQWMRHRTWNYCEASMRYQEFEGECYEPQSDSYSYKADAFAHPIGEYDWLRSSGVERETARIVLPLAMYSEVLMTVDLRNLLHWLKLRLDPAAQYEIRAYANVIHDLVSARFPTVMEVFNQELWVEENLKSVKQTLRKHFKEEQSLKPLSSSEFLGLLSSNESKNTVSEKDEVTTSVSSEGVENDPRYIQSLYDELEKNYRVILEHLQEYWESIDPLFVFIETGESKPPKDSLEST